LPGSAACFPNPRFAPVVHPTLETGVQAMAVAALAWLAA
jgi:hippurate hydrolase